MSRFVARYRKLPFKIKKRLVIENDDKSYGVADCCDIHAQTGFPVVLDTLHHTIRNEGESVRDAFMMSSATWKREDGMPIVDYSTQDQKKRPGSHAETIDPGEFRKFIAAMRGLEFDVMFEIKDKETSALQAAAILAKHRVRTSAR